MDNFEAGISYTLFFVLIFVLSLVFGAFKEMKKNKKKIYLFVIFSIFFIIMGFRKWDMGSDTISYIYLFDAIADTSEPLSAYLKRTSIETGYIIYNWLISRITHDARYLFIITSAIVNFSIGRFIYRYCDNVGLCVCFFVGFLQLDFFLSAMRHSIAIAILFSAYDALIQKKKVASFFFFLLSTTFHNASWIFLLVYFFLGNKENVQQVKSRFTLYYVLFIIIIICTFFFDNILNALLKMFPRYTYYNDSKLFDGEPRIAIMLKIIVYSIIYIIPKLFVSTKNNNISLYNDGEKTSVINIALIIIAHNATALMRLTSTFVVYATMHYSNCINKVQKNYRVILTLTSIFCIFIYGLIIVVLKTPEWQTTYPIKIGFNLQ